MRQETQKTRVLNHLNNENSITPLEALNKIYDSFMRVTF